LVGGDRIEIAHASRASKPGLDPSLSSTHSASACNSPASER
jgi:hypothetical protein